MPAVPAATLYQWMAKYLKKMALLRCPMLSHAAKEYRMLYLHAINRRLFETFLISDEKWFYIRTDRFGQLAKGIYLVDKWDKRRYVRVKQGKIRVQIWAGVSLEHGCTPPCLSMGNVKAVNYVKMLGDVVEPMFGDKLRSGEMIFQQDNARIHTAARTQEAIMKWEWHSTKWPACSCDFSPVEFVWCLMCREIESRYRPRTAAQLMWCIKKVWPRVTTPDILQKCWNRAISNMQRSYADGGDNRYFKPCRSDLRVSI